MVFPGYSIYYSIWAGTVKVPFPVLKGCMLTNGIVMVPATLLKKMLTAGTVKVSVPVLKGCLPLEQ